MSDDEKPGRYPVRTGGPMYLHKMPTEVLKDEVAELKDEIVRLRAELIATKQAVCPDSQCENCKRHRAWESLNGDVWWLACPTCKAYQGQPCRRAWKGGGGSYDSVLRRPHKGRPGTLRAAQDPPEATP